MRLLIEKIVVCPLLLLLLFKTRKFSVGPNSVEGKYFADTLDGVVKHGNTLEGSGRYSIIQADLPNNAPSLYTWPNLDGNGPARFLHIDDLQGNALTI